MKRLLHGILALTMILSMTPAMAIPTAAKTTPNGETVNTVLFYATDASGNRVLVSQIPVEDLVSDHTGLPVHNYSLLDRYVTTVHQEATGLTVPEFVTYASGKSSDSDIQGENFSFTGSDRIAFWEIDQTGYDDMDTYTYDDLYGVSRYNFPELYRYWDYTRQDYADPDSGMSREEVIDYLMETAEPEQMILSVTAFSQRYMNTDEKFGEQDYNMENYWDSEGLLDSERTIRLMIPMTEEILRDKASTASDTRYWVSQILLEMSGAPSFVSKGTVAAPTADMTEDDSNYYVRFNCETPDATIYFNHNYQSPSYMPTCPYDGDVLEIPKRMFKSGTVTLTAHAVRDGYDDEGVVTLSLTSSGQEIPEQKPEVQCGKGGTAELSDNGTVLKVTPDEGYQVKEVTLNGSSKGAVSHLEDLKTGDLVTVAFEKQSSSVEPTQPSDPAQPSNPSQPSDPAQPSNPSQPSDPAQPSNPSQPSDPVQPSNPSQPSEPTQPSNPEKDPGSTEPVKKSFTDVAEDAWYAAAVKHVTEKGYFQGTSDTEFSPDMQMTRAMFVTVLGRRAGIDPSAYSGSDFQDVPEGQWYSAYVKWASQNGIVTGVGGGQFLPDGPVTREQMAAIMYRYADYCKLDRKADDARFITFADRDKVSEYAKEAMIWATDRGIINGTEKGLEPGAKATRAQVAQIIINYTDKAAQV